MDPGTVFMDELELKDLAHVLAQALQVPSHAPGTLLVGEETDRRSDDLGDRVADDIGHPLVGKDHDTLSVDQSDALVEVLDEEPVPILALLQDLLYLPLSSVTVAPEDRCVGDGIGLEI